MAKNKGTVTYDKSNIKSTLWCVDPITHTGKPTTPLTQKKKLSTQILALEHIDAQNTKITKGIEHNT
jgi:hypothetical protein